MFLRGYDKVVAAGIAAIKGVGVAAIKEVDAAAGGRGLGSKFNPLRSKQHRGKSASWV